MNATGETAIGSALPERTIKAKNVQAREGRNFELNIHDDASAQKLGFKRGFVAGGQSLGWLSQLLVDYFGASYFRGGQFQATFAAPIFDDEDVTLGGQVRDRVPEGDGVRLVCDVWLKKEDGTTAVAGTASAVV